jgi:protein-disulfide isomerase
VLRVEPEIVADYVATGKVRLAFHHVLDHGQSSQTAHVAAECAGRQSPLAFWRLHGILYERQAELWRTTPELMAEFASAAGLDAEAFAACVADPDVAAHVERMDQERRAAGIRQRPSFDVNGRIIEGSLPYPALAQVLDEMMP